MKWELVESVNAQDWVTAFDKAFNVDGFNLSLENLTSLLNKGAEYFVIKDENEVIRYRGIFEIEGDTMFIFAIIGKGITNWNIREALCGEMESAAKSLNCNAIEFVTGRNGMLKMAIQNGFSVKEINLRKEF